MLHGWKGNFAYGFTNLVFWGLPCFLIYLGDLWWRRYRTLTVLTDCVIRHAVVVLSEADQKRRQKDKGAASPARQEKEREEDSAMVLDATVAFVKIVRPAYVQCRAGQVIWVRCPKISLIQWHPFSLCSSPSERDLRLMIGKRGEWTTNFIRLLAACNAAKDLHDDSHAIYPRIDIDGPFGAPADYSVNFRRAVFIGATTGMAPFLGFLNSMTELMSLRFKRQEILAEEAEREREAAGGGAAFRTRYIPRPDGGLQAHDSFIEEFSEIRRAHFVWTNRRLDELFGAFDELIFLVLCPVEIPLTFSLFITVPREKLPAEHELLISALEALVAQAELVRRRLKKKGHGGVGGGGAPGQSTNLHPVNENDPSRQPTLLPSELAFRTNGVGGPGGHKFLEIHFNRYPKFDQELGRVLPSEETEDLLSPSSNGGRGASMYEEEEEEDEGPVGVFVCAGPKIQKSVLKGIQKLEGEGKGTNGSPFSGSSRQVGGQSQRGVRAPPKFVLVKEDFS
uniref:FAD-binding FR-type domain-containing protein n=1 Tax=Chromera velia CCMP2878 TaxID=1169474 RepID=A0A0G4H980_9ALVE|eukprot:Cvel_25364.t1-p1 / transcript=Cvel_25364.t1 / gene=Cvel_25364 / organism=Chromera_velia_CCMP2878 / gene_product=NADPH oxidase 1, putative / transcript_product=NADPH oxidase 1, putative / location=Cvel_scaffold2863:10963-13988(-) / protein_length=507 / sequence_SO=supercontig / SO=protein_coding / is_pseudo=false